MIISRPVVLSTFFLFIYKSVKQNILFYISPVKV